MRTRPSSQFVILIFLMIPMLVSCSQQPAEIHYGSDECAHCKMIIADSRFVAQMVTKTGKSIKFDAIECMARYAGDHKTELESAKLWLGNFDNPGEWIALENAYIIQSRVINSPMGESLLAFKSEQQMKEHLAEYPGEHVTWQRLVK